MDTDRRNSTKRIIFMKKARDFFNKQIQKEEDKLKRKLTKEERKENRKKNHKSAKLIAIVGTSFAIGILAGREGGKLLDAGNTIEVAKDNNEITIDTNGIGENKTINIKNSTKNGRSLFVDGLRIEEDDLETIQKLEQNVHDEIDKLEGRPKQVLTYIKELYANEHNQKEGADVTSDDISINRMKTGGRTKVEKNDGSWIGDNMIMRITIDNKENPDEIEVPYIRFENNNPKEHIYSPGAIRLVNSLTVMDMGLDWIDNEAKYGASKEGFEHAIIEYKKSKMNDIAIGYDISDGDESSIAKKEGDKMMGLRGDENEVVDLTHYFDGR